MAISTAAIWLAVLIGCSRNIQNKEAVRQGVIDHLAKGSGLDLKTMDIDVTAVSFRQDHANATVHFQPKDSATPGNGLQMTYNLDRQGDHWVVKGKPRSGVGGEPHGVGGMLPPEGGGLPPGHPSVESPARPVK